MVTNAASFFPTVFVATVVALLYTDCYWSVYKLRSDNF